MAISWVGDAHDPSTENANSPSGPTVTVTPPGGMALNDFVLVSVYYRGNVDWTVSTNGGQSWSNATETGDGTYGTLQLYWCVYDGTWDANPVWTVTTGTAGANCWMSVFRNVDTSTPWDISPSLATQASSTSYVISSFSPTASGAWALVGAASMDNNTWTVNNSFAALDGTNVGWRSASGTDNSQARAYRAASGALGDTTLTQATLGGDAGCKWYAALKPGIVVPPPFQTHPFKLGYRRFPPASVPRRR